MYGDYNPDVHKPGFLKDKLQKVLPRSMVTSKRKVEFERRVLVKFAAMTNLNIGETKVLEEILIFFCHIFFVQLLYVAYLKHCRQWKYYGAILFDLTLQTKGARLMVIVHPTFIRLLMSLHVNSYSVSWETGPQIRATAWDWNQHFRIPFCEQGD